jgi:hypothetical protein
MTRASLPCSAKLRNGDPCRSVATDREFCAYHAALAAQLGAEEVSELIAAMQRAVNDPQYRPPSWSSPRDIDDHAALITGVAGRRLEHDSFTEGSRVWVMTFQDDLLYRSRVFTSAEGALRYYGEHGVDLGIPGVDRGVIT